MKKEPALISALQRASMDKGRSKFFLVFFLFSFLLWFITKFSKEYTEVISLQMEIEHIPATVIPILQQPPRIEFTLKASGFQFLYYQFFDDRLQVDFQAAEMKDGRATLPIGAQFQQLQEQLLGSTEIINYFPAILEFDYQQQTSKRVVVLPPKLNLAPGYAATAVSFKPDSIDIIGPSESLEKMNNIQPLLTATDPIQESFTRLLSFPVNDQFISLSSNQVEIKVDVDRFSEAKFQLPIEMLHLPPGQVGKFFPSKVTLTFSAPLSRLREITPTDFTVGMDYAQIEDNGNSIQIKLLKAPNGIINVRMEPKEAQYLMRR